MERKIEKVFGDNIRCLREKHGLSREEMSKRVGISESDLSELEGGTVSPHIMLDMLFTIEKEFGEKAYKLFI